MVSLSVVVPTAGRETLRATLESLRGQVGPRDEVIVVADAGANHPRAEQIFDLVAGSGEWAAAWRYEEWPCHPLTERPLGYEQRNRGMDLATGSHLAFMDDDDVYTPGAFDAFRAHAADVPVIFRMRYMSDRVYKVAGELLYGPKALVYTNVGTPMFLVPNRPPMPRWGPYDGSYDGKCGGDFGFITGCVDLMGDPIWREEVVALIRPHEAA